MSSRRKHSKGGKDGAVDIDAMVSELIATVDATRNNKLGQELPVFYPGTRPSGPYGFPPQYDCSIGEGTATAVITAQTLQLQQEQQQQQLQQQQQTSRSSVVAASAPTTLATTTASGSASADFGPSLSSAPPSSPLNDLTTTTSTSQQQQKKIEFPQVLSCKRVMIEILKQNRNSMYTLGIYPELMRLCTSKSFQLFLYDTFWWLFLDHCSGIDLNKLRRHRASGLMQAQGQAKRFGAVTQREQQKSDTSASSSSLGSAGYGDLSLLLNNDQVEDDTDNVLKKSYSVRQKIRAKRTAADDHTRVLPKHLYDDSDTESVATNTSSISSVSSSAASSTSTSSSSSSSYSASSLNNNNQPYLFGHQFRQLQRKRKKEERKRLKQEREMKLKKEREAAEALEREKRRQQQHMEQEKREERRMSRVSSSVLVPIGKRKSTTNMLKRSQSISENNNNNNNNNNASSIAEQSRQLWRQAPVTASELSNKPKNVTPSVIYRDSEWRRSPIHLALSATPSARSVNELTDALGDDVLMNASAPEKYSKKTSVKDQVIHEVSACEESFQEEDEEQQQPPEGGGEHSGGGSGGNVFSHHHHPDFGNFVVQQQTSQHSFQHEDDDEKSSKVGGDSFNNNRNKQTTTTTRKKDGGITFHEEEEEKGKSHQPHPPNRRRSSVTAGVGPDTKQEAIAHQNKGVGSMLMASASLANFDLHQMRQERAMRNSQASFGPAVSATASALFAPPSASSRGGGGGENFNSINKTTSASVSLTSSFNHHHHPGGEGGGHLSRTASQVQQEAAILSTTQANNRDESDDDQDYQGVRDDSNNDNNNNNNSPTSSSRSSSSSSSVSSLASSVKTVDDVLRIRSFAPSQPRYDLYNLPGDARRSVVAREQHVLFTRMSERYVEAMMVRNLSSSRLQDNIIRILPEMVCQFMYTVFYQLMPCFRETVTSREFQNQIFRQVCYMVGGVERECLNPFKWKCHLLLGDGLFADHSQEAQAEVERRKPRRLAAQPSFMRKLAREVTESTNRKHQNEEVYNHLARKKHSPVRYSACPRLPFASTSSSSGGGGFDREQMNNAAEFGDVVSAGNNNNNKRTKNNSNVINKNKKKKEHETTTTNQTGKDSNNNNINNDNGDERHLGDFAAFQSAKFGDSTPALLLEADSQQQLLLRERQQPQQEQRQKQQEKEDEKQQQLVGGMRQKSTTFFIEGEQQQQQQQEQQQQQQEGEDEKEKEEEPTTPVGLTRRSSGLGSLSKLNAASTKFGSFRKEKKEQKRQEAEKRRKSTLNKTIEKESDLFKQEMRRNFTQKKRLSVGGSSAAASGDDSQQQQDQRGGYDNFLRTRMSGGASSSGGGTGGESEMKERSHDIRSSVGVKHHNRNDKHKQVTMAERERLAGRGVSQFRSSEVIAEEKEEQRRLAQEKLASLSSLSSSQNHQGDSNNNDSSVSRNSLAAVHQLHMRQKLKFGQHQKKDGGENSSGGSEDDDDETAEGKKNNNSKEGNNNKRDDKKTKNASSSAISSSDSLLRIGGGGGGGGANNNNSSVQLPRHIQEIKAKLDARVKNVPWYASPNQRVELRSDHGNAGVNSSNFLAMELSPLFQRFASSRSTVSTSTTKSHSNTTTTARNIFPATTAGGSSDASACSSQSGGAGKTNIATSSINQFPIRPPAGNLKGALKHMKFTLNDRDNNANQETTKKGTLMNKD